jgi:peroxiredoxin Q/BCP
MSGARAPAFELPNVGPGPDPIALSDLTVEGEFVVLFFQRGYRSTPCREQVTRIAKRIDGFLARNAAVAAVVPEPREQVERWRERIDPPFPLLADPEGTAGPEYGQSIRLDAIDDWSDFFGRMPLVAVVDARGLDPEIAWTYRSNWVSDRPKTAAILDAVDEVADER